MATDDELIEQFTEHRDITRDDIPDPIWTVMQYIHENTGLTGDYHDGQTRLIEDGNTIQIFSRSTYLSSHSDLLTWLQCSEDAEDVIFGQIGARLGNHENRMPYVEIHEKSRWWDDE
jgi:hypothetical protein